MHLSPKVWSSLLLLALLLGMLIKGMPPTHAQDNSQTPTPVSGNTIVHIVQRGETLLRIAQLYGTTVDAIMLTNGIQDVRFISTGQRLLIPDSRSLTPGANVTHTVAAGETLYTIALKYQVPVGLLAELNGVMHPGRLYIGQTISIGQIPVSANLVSYYTVQADDTLLRIAVRSGIPLAQLQSANGLLTGQPVFAGQILALPGPPATMEARILPDPLTDLSLIPSSPRQGQSISLRLQTQAAVTVSGSFMERPFQMEKIDPTSDAYQYGAVLGIHAFTTPGVYPLNLILTRVNGQTTLYELRLRVLDGGYGNEAVSFPADKQDLLLPAVVQSELDKVLAIVTGFTQERYFDGWMALPTAGSVTSQFGTRRTYNGNPYETFHGGTDFGGTVGTPVVAPAAGVVVLAEPLQVRGNAVILDHGWGVYTGYWHLVEINVTPGQILNKGDLIGALGATGLATGPHLHWEIWVGGVQVDAMQWVQQPFP